MPKITLTDTAIARLPSAQTGTDWYSDTRVEGLQLAVGKRKRTFYISKSLRNRQLRVKVGEWPLVPTEGARKKARILLGEISSGIDPRRSAAPDDALTVQQALDRYIAARTGARKRQKQITDGTAQNYRDLFRCHAKRWMSRDLASITADEVSEKHERMINQASAANKLVRVFRSLQREFGITPPPKFNFYEENRKENGVKPVDRAAFGAAIHAVENVSRRAAWLLGLYTGIRKNTLLALEWDHVDFQEGTVFIAKMKNRHARTLPLSRQAIAVLRGLEGLHPKWVLPSFDGSKSGHLIEVRDDAIDDSICFHDTRRVFSECGAECLLPEYAIGYLRGDVVNQSTAQRYMSHLEMQEPAQRIGDRIEAQLFSKAKKAHRGPEKVGSRSTPVAVATARSGRSADDLSRVAAA